MPIRQKRAANYSVAVNIFLFLIKAVIGFLSNSIAVISEALNSLTDIVSSGAIRYAISLSGKQPDEKHQFGHNAAQPIAAFIVAVFAFVVGIKIVEESVKRILEPGELHVTPAIYIVMAISIVMKIGLYFYQKKIGRMFDSPALKAAAADSMNDVLSSAIALLAIICAAFGIYFVDGIAGILVALFIFKTGYEVGRENIDYLMARSADETLISQLTEKALRTEGVKGFNDVRSYYVGNQFHIEIHIEVNEEYNTRESHDIGKQVQKKLEEIEGIQKVFVHIDPV